MSTIVLVFTNTCSTRMFYSQMDFAGDFRYAVTRFSV